MDLKMAAPQDVSGVVIKRREKRVDLDWANESLGAAWVVQDFRERCRVCTAAGNAGSNWRAMLLILHDHSSRRRVA